MPGSVTASLPIKLCVTSYDDSGWDTVGVKFNTATGNPALATGVTPLPSDQIFSRTGNPDTLDGSGLYHPDGTPFNPANLYCKTADIVVSASGLVHNFYQATVNLSAADISPSGSAKITFDPNSSQIKIRAQVVSPTENLVCYVTDSNGDWLFDCNGKPVTVSGTDDGRFVIVANNKSIEVATNPGQFYYNLLYKNTTGGDLDVDVTLTPDGVSPHGAQAIHWYVFDTTGNFNTVNESGTPCGTTGPCNDITVPDTQTLWVTYHVTWNGLGAPVPPNCPKNCADATNDTSFTLQLFSVDGEVDNDDTHEVIGHCAAGAYGYLKH